jgi:putative endonuclease
LVEAAEIYLEEKDLNCEVRFDIISIIKNQKESKVYHIIDAFRG